VSGATLPDAESVATGPGPIASGVSTVVVLGFEVPNRIPERHFVVLPAALLAALFTNLVKLHMKG
jgi:hypothetical protein